MAAVALTLNYEVIDANDDCVALMRLTPEHVRGRPVHDFLPTADHLTALQTAREVAAAPMTPARPVSALRRVISGDGQDLTCWTHVGIADLGGYRCFVVCIDLVNPMLSHAHRWRHRAEHDELTGLQRRGAMLDQVSQWLEAGRIIVLAFLDIDDFKSINDTHGHAAGDHVLTTLARRLRHHAPDGCVVGRLSGDEFVLMQLVGTASDVYGRHADRLDEHRTARADLLLAVGNRCVAEPIAWGEHLLTISLSVGHTVSEPDEDPCTLLARADDEMYVQKGRSLRLTR